MPSMVQMAVGAAMTSLSDPAAADAGLAGVEVTDVIVGTAPLYYSERYAMAVGPALSQACHIALNTDLLESRNLVRSLQIATTAKNLVLSPKAGTAATAKGL